ncbi:MAG: esterase-like activity of phytase family protein [Planctomycetes bacterium]|nr:esterase-like activity of phytase family protein [Planctomycetota bacterium]
MTTGTWRRTMACGGTSRFAVMLAAMAAGVAAPIVGRCAAAGDRDRRDGGDMRGHVVATCEIPRVMLAAPSGEEPAVLLGGISDLFVETDADAGAPGNRRAWLVTDRGPNGTTEVEGRPHRTLAAPSYAPRILEATIDWDARQPSRLAVHLTGTVTLRDRAGENVTGRPNGLDNDPVIFDPQGRETIAPDVDGVDTEGLVRTRAGAFWLAEEYRPSLLAATADGTLQRRLVPAGAALAGAGVEVIDSLPAVYSQRRDNRGFEALAISPDEMRIFALMQSPLDGTDPAVARALGNVRLVVVDPARGRPVGEYAYRLGDPEQKGYRQGKAAPDDGKLCAMAALGPMSLLVLEQADGGVARLYRADLAVATDTLSRTIAGDEPPAEMLRDLDEADITPVAKTLLADLAPILDDMRGGTANRGSGRRGVKKSGPLKLEGLAVADEQHIFLVNDDDFGIHEDADDDPPPRTCLWVVRLARPITLTQR